ncbi:MAG: hypothetical protein CML56_08520 [Rhodobacteraceae bacterium]|nr:hypothetical protein [Paracoccaceae bacterium]
MTRERYLELCEQMGNEPIEEEIPPDWSDLPEIVTYAVNTFNLMGDRVYPEIGYVGKDYTNLNHYIELYAIEDKEFFLHVLSWLDSRAIKKSSDQLKREYDKMKRQSSGKQSSPRVKGR